MRGSSNWNFLLSGCAAAVMTAFSTTAGQAQASFLMRGSIAPQDTPGTIGGSVAADGSSAAGNADNTYVPVSEGALPESGNSSAPVPVVPPRLDSAAQITPVPPPGAPESVPVDSAGGAGMPPLAPAGQPPAAPSTTGSIYPAPAGRAQKSQRENLPENAIEGATPKTEDDPFAPPGIRAGDFIIRPSLEQGLRVTDNVNNTADGKSSVLSETTLRLGAESDWSRHSVSFNGYLTAVKSVAGAEYSEPLAGFEAAMRLDLNDDVNVNANLGYTLSRESGNDPVNLGSTSIPPLQQEIVAALGATKTAGKLVYNLTGGVDRQAYGEAELIGGGTVSQKDRNNTLLTATLRTGYEISPAVTPFAAAQLGTTVYDQAVDQNGYDRSSFRTGLRAGTRFDFGEKLNGEFSLGWLRQTFDDPRLRAISGPVVLANVNWSPRRLTTVELNALTTAEASTTPGESGDLLYSVDTTATRRIRANLSASATLGGYYRNYTGSNAYDIAYFAGVGFTYWLNPNLGLIGTLRREQVYSTDPGREFASDSAYLGVRVQR